MQENVTPPVKFWEVLICLMQSTNRCLMSEQKKEPKITKLPRNGPKKGQSMNSWLHGKKLGDADWAKKIRKAQDERKI